VANSRFGLRNVPPLATLTAAAAAVLIIVIAVFVFLGQSPGGPTSTAPVAGQGGCAGEPGDGAVATIKLTGDLDFTCTLEGPSGDVSPTDSLIAAVWTETVDDPNLQYGDLITVVVGGPVFDGTQSTAADGIAISFGWGRISAKPDASGNPVDIFDHLFSSKDGECSVAMQATATGVTGTFDCPAITDGDGHTVKAIGTFNL